MPKKSKKQGKVFDFLCAFCGVPKRHTEFTLCETIQEHVREFPPRKRNPHATGKCNECYKKEMIASLPGKGWWAAIKRVFGIK